jgi:putative ABC transport system permease protein
VRLHSIALGNLRRRMSRSAFLVAGLLAGIATVVSLLTLNDSLRVEAQNNLETYGANIVVTPRSEALSLSYGGVELGEVAVGRRDLREAGLARIDDIENRRNIAVVAPELLGAAEVEGRRRLIVGVRPREEFRLKGWWEVEGRPPRGGDEVVAGSAAAAALRLRPGSSVEVAGRSFSVSGVLQPTGGRDDGLLIMELAAAQDVLGKPGRVTSVQVAALCSDCPIEDIVMQLGAALPGSQVTAMRQVVENRMAALERFRVFGLVVAGFIIAVESLVVFVTMMGSVSARTREIGVFRALGFRRGHVTRLILLEAAFASLLAGALGYLVGMAVSHALVPLFTSSGQVPVTWTPWLAPAAVGLALLIGALASLYPALRASRLDPTVALRAI